MNETLYMVETIPLAKERRKGVNSSVGPREIRCTFDYLCVLYLDGEASLSFSLTEREDYFDLVQGMRATLPEGTKSIYVINPAQENKKLVLFLGYKGRSEVKR